MDDEDEDEDYQPSKWKHTSASTEAGPVFDKNGKEVAGETELGAEIIGIILNNSLL